MDGTILKNMKKGENLFIVNLESVSLFPPENLKNIANNDEKYQKTPFLYLISSYARNKSLHWANDRMEYIGKKQTGSWIVYNFKK